MKLRKLLPVLLLGLVRVAELNNLVEKEKPYAAGGGGGGTVSVACVSIVCIHSN